MKPTAQPQKKFNLLLDISIVYLLSLIIFHRFQFQGAYIPGTDGYYHIKYAYLLRTEGFMSNFKWASLSIWRESFSDKEFLFHVFLIPFTWFSDLAYGAKMATVAFAAATTTSFYAVLRLNAIRHAWFWTLLLWTAGGYYLYRANVPRPQVLSISLCIWTIHFILNRKLKPLAAISFFYCWTYTAYHLPLVFSSIVWCHHFLFRKENLWQLPATTGAAMLAGMVIHPYFPNNFTFFYLQNFFVLAMSLQKKVDLHMGSEFRPMTTLKMIQVNTSTLIPYFAVFFSAISRPIQTTPKTVNAFLLSLSLLFLTCMTKRFAEYSVPITLFFCALYFQPVLDRFSIAEFLYPERKRLNLQGIGNAVMVAAVIGILAVRSYRDVAPQFRTRPSRFKSAAEYLLAHTADNEVVYTCDWDDAPDLFFYNHKNRYLVFLDPNFMYYWNKAWWTKWDRLSNGRLGMRSYETFKNDFKVRYGVCTSNFKNLRRIIERDPKLSIVHQTKHLYVFKLDS